MSKTATSIRAKEYRRFFMSDPYDGQSTNKDVPGVSGENTVDGGVGVRGQSKSAGVVGVGETWHGVTGLSSSTSGGAGVFGASDVGPGIIGESKVWHAVYGKSDSTVGGTGVTGEHTGSGAGTAGRSNTGIGVYGESKTYEGVRGVSHSRDHGGVVGTNDGGGTAVFGTSTSGAGVSGKGNPAGFFEGNLTVTGDVLVQGTALSSLIQRIKQLEAQVAALMQHTGGSGPIGGSGPTGGLDPVIQATLTPGVSGEVLTVSGRGFMPLESVEVNVQVKVNGAPTQGNGQNVSADSQGAIVHTQTVQCGAGQITTFEVRATGNSSHKTSNLAGASC